MIRLEKVDGDTWREFLSAPVAVLVLGKTGCPACQAFAYELEEYLADDAQPHGDARWRHVRFGKMLLDERGLTDFKRASPWLADVDVLPFTQIYRAGERWKDFAGGGIDRLLRRLESLPRSPSDA